MKTIFDYVDEIPFQENRTRKQFQNQLRTLLRKDGVNFVNAIYAHDGDCITCGECGRCPGIHLVSEIKKA